MYYAGDIEELWGLLREVMWLKQQDLGMVFAFWLIVGKTRLHLSKIIISLQEFVQMHFQH